MRDRYERLYALPELLYTAGSPVIIEAGALLKDNQYNSAVAQLKFKNISDTVIKAISVRIFTLDTAQRPLGEPIIFQYLDSSAKRDENFGQDVPVVLPDPVTRAFYASVKEIVFENNEVWNGSDDIWQPLPAAVPLNDFFKDSEMTKQFKLRYGSDCSVCPVQIGDLWYCTCGKINHINEFACHSCGKNANELFHVDLGSLASEKEERLRKEAWEKQLAEQKATAEEAQKEAENKARIKKAKKQKIIGWLVVSIVAILAGIWFFVIQPMVSKKFFVNKYGQEAVEKYGVSIFKKYGEEFFDKNGIDFFAKLRNKTKGSVITFGTYEQDNNTQNGKEPVEWIILDKNSSSALLISKDILDYHLYYYGFDCVTWSKSDMQFWLNHSFLNDAFSTDEQKAIQRTTLHADKPQDTDEIGKDTNDMVFLLSVDEVQKYFKSESSRIAKASAYAVSLGAFVSHDGYTNWGTRTPLNCNFIAEILSNGKFSNNGSFFLGNFEVRPALWISLEYN